MMNLIDGAEVAPLQTNSSEIDVVGAIRAAQKAFAAWSAVAPSERARLVEDALGADPEIARAADCGRLPLGVVGVILPRVAAGRTLKPWLAALLTSGNTVVIKPSSKTPDEIRALLPRLALLPPGVCNVVFGAGDPVGRFLVEHPGVPAIAFAGRAETGRAVMTCAATGLKRVTLSLGAKNAAIVLKDADLELAATTLARAAFRFGGADPMAISKILVASDVFDAFHARLVAAAPEWVDADADFERWVALAREENGRVTGGAREGARVRPVVVSELTNCSEIHQTELLQPIVTVNAIKYAAEGVKWANVTPFGRAAALFTNDRRLAEKLAPQLVVGEVWINAWGDAPSGVPQKQSGAGEPDVLRLATREPLLRS